MKHKSTIDPFVFVVGCGRSGTTLLRAMLDSHPALAVPPEAPFVPLLLREHAGRFDVDRFVTQLQAHRKFSAWRLDARTVRDALSAGGVKDAPSAVRQLYRLYANGEDKPRYADKTPPNVMQMKALADAIPEARFVHLVRDGRDAARSIASNHFGPDDVLDAAIYWQRHVVKGRRTGRALGPDRYLEIRYEDLVSRPTEVLTDVCALARLDYHPAMLTYPTRSRDIIVSTGAPGAHVNVARPPTADPPADRRLDADTSLQVEALIAGTLRSFGYQLYCTAIPRRMRVGAARRRVASLFLRIRSRLTRRVAGFAQRG